MVCGWIMMCCRNVKLLKPRKLPKRRGCVCPASASQVAPVRGKTQQGDQESPFARAAQAEAWQSCERLLHQRDSPLSIACWAGCIKQAHQEVF